METIKNYLETMFANLPNTEEVRKAKSELYQMMEDKYSELIAEGKTENEAVGTVISEFGNLEDLAEDLNLTREMTDSAYSEDALNRRFIPLDEAKEFINATIRSGMLVGVGVFLCITSVIWPIISEFLKLPENVGVLSMFIAIFLAVAIFVFNSIEMKQWEFIKHSPCQIDMMCAEYVSEERKKYAGTFALKKTVGVVLCAACWLPSVFFENIPFLGDDIGGIILFIMVGIGVYMLITAGHTMKTYERLLSVNNKKTISGHYSDSKNVEYINDTVATIMAVYWPTVTSIYFIWSFITFDWHISWIIWPVAAIVSKVIKINLVVRK